MIFYDDFCRDVLGCENYIEWEYEMELPNHNGTHESTILCVSCTLVGQSYNIDAYPECCPYIDRIKKFEHKCEQEKIWKKLNDIT